MRPCFKSGLPGFAAAISLTAALAICTVPASAALLDLGEGSESSPGSLAGALPSLGVQAGSLAGVEVSTSPQIEAKAEVAGLPAIETPPLSTPKAPAPPPVEVPTVSTEAPLPSTPVTGSSGSSSSSGSGTTARAASTAASSAATGSSQPATATAAGATPATARADRTTRHGVRTAAAKRASRAHGAAASATSSPAGVAATTALAAAGSPAGANAHPKSSSSGNPLDSIGRHIPFPVPVPDWSKPIILALLLLAIWLGVRARLATRRARRLAAEQAAMLGDLDEMQKALVPPVPRRVGALAVSVAYRPAEGPAAGGDFYDLFELGGGRVAIVLGDVVGHGRRSLAQAALTRYTLRAYLQAGLEPRAALALAGSVLSTPGEMRFATVVIAVHDRAGGRLTYACAGHPAPIAVGFETAEPVSACCSAPIGCELPTGRRQTTISLPAGGGICFFSDGLPEARTARGLLGGERLTEILAELGPAAGAPELLRRVRAEATATPDDMVACIVSPAGRPPAPGAQVEELEVDPQMLAGPRVRRFLEGCGVGPARIAPVLAEAGELAQRGDRALLRVERPLRGGGPAVEVTACVAAPDPAVAVARAAEPALALQAGR